ncbi:MAG: DUF4386 domain-containing protein [Bacillota bacterium]
MTIGSVTEPQRLAARIAGFALVFGFAIVVFAQFWLSAPLIVANDAAQTAANILAHETRFRGYAVCNLVYVMDLVVLSAALYVVLRPVNQGLALAAAFLRFMYAVLWILVVLNLFGALALLGPAPYLKALAPEQLAALSRMHIRVGFDAYYVGLPFFALASTLCAWLWWKSGYVPKALAGFGLAASGWGVFCGIVYLVFPHFNATVNDWLFDTPLGLFELAVGFWLLFRGIRAP